MRRKWSRGAKASALWLSLIAACLVACSATESGVENDDVPLTCTSGTQQLCQCGASPGVQFCASSVWTGCDCDAPPPSCQPPQAIGCTCADGSSGVAQCQVDGTYGQCACTAAGTGGVVGAGGEAGAGGSGAVPGGALPCDVATILERECHECHGRATQFGAPTSLLTVGDLTAPASPAYPGRMVADVLLEKVQAPATGRMPPAPRDALTTDQIAALQNWVAAGAPEATAATACAPEPGAGGMGGLGGLGGTAGLGGLGGTAGMGGLGTGGAAGAGAGGEGGGIADPDAPADCQDFYELRAHGQQAPGDTTPYPVPIAPADSGNQYWCFYFDPPYDAESQGLWFKSLEDDTRVLHHWLLYGTDAKAHAAGTSGPCSAAEPGAYLLAGWAPGADDSKLPADVGLQMPTGPTAGLILEVHYFNTQGLEAEDRSGVRMCTAPKDTREHLAAVHFTGSEGICIPPQSQHTVTGPCVPRQDLGDIHIVNVWPHMHQFGTRMTTTIHRAGGTTEMLHDEPFDFNAQISYPKDVVLKAGDWMETQCTFQNSTAEQVHFGDRTQDEMCFNFITAWPAGALGQDPFSAVFNPANWLQPARRCMDPVSILQSCNGLGDYPVP